VTSTRRRWRLRSSRWLALAVFAGDAAVAGSGTEGRDGVMGRSQGTPVAAALRARTDRTASEAWERPEGGRATASASRAEDAADRLLPAAVPLVALGARRRRLEARLLARQRGELALVLPEADGEPGEERGAGRGRLGLRRAHDGDAEEVGERPAEELVLRRAAVDPQLAHAQLRVALHAFDDVARLERHRLERRARQVRLGRPAREADDRAARVGVPVRRPEPDERRHERDAAAVGHRPREPLDLR